MWVLINIPLAWSHSEREWKGNFEWHFYWLGNRQPLLCPWGFAPFGFQASCAAVNEGEYIKSSSESLALINALGSHFSVCACHGSQCLKLLRWHFNPSPPHLHRRCQHHCCLSTHSPSSASELITLPCGSSRNIFLPLFLPSQGRQCVISPHIPSKLLQELWCYPRKFLGCHAKNQ